MKCFSLLFCAIAVATLCVAAPALAADRSTYVMNASASSVTVFIRAGSRAIVEDIAAKGQKIIPWQDYGLKTIEIIVKGCGTEHTLKLEPTTYATVLHISPDTCSLYIQNGNR
jgi:hypothetical protein